MTCHDCGNLKADDEPCQYCDIDPADETLDGCHHGIGFDEECEDCDEEEAWEDSSGMVKP